MADREAGPATGGGGLLSPLVSVASRLLDGYGRLREQWYGPLAVLAVAVVALAVLPELLEVSVLGASLGTVLSVHILVIALVWATAAQSWNLISGFAGQFSLGHAAFFGLGAYVPIILVRELSVNPWLGMLVGGLVAGLYGLLIGGLCFRYRLRGNYFTLATLAFAELLRHVFINVPTLGGASGFVRPLPRVYAAEYGLLAFQFRSNRPYYYVILAFLALVSLVALVVKQSQLGLHLAAIRDDEDAAMSVGIPAARYKLFALTASAFFTAWVGAFWAMYFTSIRPNVVYTVLVNVDILLPALVGGFGTVLGPIVGSLALTVANEVARHVVDVPGLENFVYGLLLLAIVLYSPGGVVSWPGRLVQVLRRTGSRLRQLHAGSRPLARVSRPGSRPSTPNAATSRPTTMDTNTDTTEPTLRGDGDDSQPPDAPGQQITFEDTVRLRAPAADVRSVLSDPERLEPCLPGVEDLEQASNQTYTCTISQRIDGVRHLTLELASEFELVESDEPGLVVVEGTAHDPNWATDLTVLGAVQTAAVDGGEAVDLSYTVDVAIRSRNASVDPKILGPTVRHTLEQAFENLETAANRED